MEELRVRHEDLERIEAAMAQRFLEEPVDISERLERDHVVSGLLNRAQEQSQQLLNIYQSSDSGRQQEMQALATGDPFAEFYKRLGQVKDFHRRYPNMPVENLERAYQPKPSDDDEDSPMIIDKLFSGEEAMGRYIDLVEQHEMYLNLKGISVGRRMKYPEYLDSFDKFQPPYYPIKRSEKLSDEYFKYLSSLSTYLESFLRRTKPLENLDKVFATFESEFDEAWAADKVPGWEGLPETQATAPSTVTEGVWCPACKKEFKNENSYSAHLTGDKHKKRAAAMKENGEPATNGKPATPAASTTTFKETQADIRLKERAVAQRESRIKKLASVMQTERADTKVNVERRQVLTQKELQDEKDALTAARENRNRKREGDENGEDGEDDAMPSNPLKIPLGWDGAPLPFWLYRLHGLNVEYHCEICGNYTFQGRRAYEKHFIEPRHTYGLKCLGITPSALFRDITGIDEAQKLWAKIQQDKKEENKGANDQEQVEDSMGNVMPVKVYQDLQKQGLV